MNPNNDENIKEEEIVAQANDKLNEVNFEQEIEDTSKIKFKFTIAEIVWYSIFGVIFLTGLILGILGCYAYNISNISNDPVAQAMIQFSVFLKRSSVLDWRIFGSELMVIAMVGFIITTIIYMNKFVKEKASKKKYNERLEILMNSDLASLDEQESLEKEKEKQASKE